MTPKPPTFPPAALLPSIRRPVVVPGAVARSPLQRAATPLPACTALPTMAPQPKRGAAPRAVAPPGAWLQRAPAIATGQLRTVQRAGDGGARSATLTTAERRLAAIIGHLMPGLSSGRQAPNPATATPQSPPVGTPTSPATESTALVVVLPDMGETRRKAILAEARATQGSGAYSGRDHFVASVLRAGTVIYALHPSGASFSGYGVGDYVVRHSTSTQDYHRKLQVVPGNDRDGAVRPYRTKLKAWRVWRDMQVAKGEALAQNSATHGMGGAVQYFIAADERSYLLPMEQFDILEREPSTSSGPGTARL